MASQQTDPLNRDPLPASTPDGATCLREVLAGEGLSFSQVARLLPPGRGGRPVSSSTVSRWATQGACSVGGRVFLETCRVGSKRITSRGAVERFIEALSDAGPGGQGGTPADRSRTRARQVRDAQAELERAGI